ncbi:hypothetical protein CBL_04221 [Carabus blaptoides fortunei]
MKRALIVPPNACGLCPDDTNRFRGEQATTIYRLLGQTKTADRFGYKQINQNLGRNCCPKQNDVWRCLQSHTAVSKLFAQCSVEAGQSHERTAARTAETKTSSLTATADSSVSTIFSSTLTVHI